MAWSLELQSSESGVESSCCCFGAIAISFTPYCLSSLSCINEYLAIDSDGYVNEKVFAQ